MLRFAAIAAAMAFCVFFFPWIAIIAGLGYLIINRKEVFG